MSKFVELGASAPVIEALAKRGITEPFDIQTMTIADGIAGRDVLAKSRTGSGKTLAFGIPLIERLTPGSSRPSALVLVPTRELAVQVCDELQDVARACGLEVAPVFGGVSIDSQARKARRAHIVIATPGRFTDILNRGLISVSKIEVLVLDEADRMLDMGFQPQVDRIVDRLNARRQTMFFSATLGGIVGQLAHAYTNDPVLHEIIDERPVIEEADHRFIAVDERGKLDALVGVLEEKRNLALIFVRTKRGADRLRSKLKDRNIKVASLHGDMTQALRQRTLDRFAAGKVDVLVATDVAARGLDLDGITHVINYDPPKDDKDYVHRVGRTARAGRGGAGVTFVAPSQHADVSGIVRKLDLNKEFESEGFSVGAPRRVYSSHGSRSMMRSRRRNRF